VSLGFVSLLLSADNLKLFTVRCRRVRHRSCKM